MRAQKWAEGLHNLHLLGVPTQRDKISGDFTSAFSRAHMWAEGLHNPCLLGVPNGKTKLALKGCLEKRKSGA